MNTFKKTLLTTSMGLALSLGAGQAQAVTIDLSGAGPLSMKFDFFSTEVVTPLGGSGVDDSPAYGGNVLGGATFPVNAPVTVPPGYAPGGGTLNETTFAIGRLTSISSYPTGVPSIWTNGTNGKELAVFIYGIADKSITYDNGTGDFTINNVGCEGGAYCDGLIHLDIYEMTTAQFAGAGVWVPSDRSAFDQFDGITDVGTLWAATTFTPPGRGIDTANLYSMVQTTRSATLPTTGSGAWLADCISGPACAYLDTNGQANGADFFGQFTLETTPLTNGWTGYANDPIIGNAVPEPGFLSLFGAGLLGMGFFRRFANRRG